MYIHLLRIFNLFQFYAFAEFFLYSITVVIVTPTVNLAFFQRGRSSPAINRANCITPKDTETQGDPRKPHREQATKPVSKCKSVMFPSYFVAKEKRALHLNVAVGCHIGINLCAKSKSSALTLEMPFPAHSGGPALVSSFALVSTP